ncbi:hypothetical protein G9P44_001598 [Scheffersomyces stipitis]|nr:hypothetical protein G9P44_001598 [Scheffersomyces stipitis]
MAPETGPDPGENSTESIARNLAAEVPNVVSENSQSVSNGISSRTSENPFANVDDTTPLLNSNESYTNENNEDENNTTNDTNFNNNDDEYDTQSKFDSESVLKKIKRPFWWFFALGIVAIIIFELSFLPRTSLSRDFRRWYGLHLTRSDVKRHFILFSGIGNSHDSLTTEEYINTWLTNLTAINSKSPANIIADDNIELVSLVEKTFKKFGFKTSSHSYDVPFLQRPQSSSVSLVDSSNGNVVYNANLKEPHYKTPAFYAFGANSSAAGDYIFVNEGTISDYLTLTARNYDINGKIVIVKSVLNSNISVAEKVLIAEKFGAIGFINYYDLQSENNKESELQLNIAISRDNVVTGHIGNWKRPSIPAIPLSRKAVNPILGTLAKSKQMEVVSEWEYNPTNIGGSLTLNISAVFEDTKTRRLTNIVGTLKGVMNDGNIIIGARRDSLTSSNPSSGHAVLFEIMRNYQRLTIKGWKPLRTIKFISWDGSSSGVLGSQLLTNDTNVLDPKQSVIAYINIDGDAVTGSRFKVDSNPLFNHLLRKTAKYVPIPKTAASYKTLSEVDKEKFFKSLDDTATNQADEMMKIFKLTQDDVTADDDDADDDNDNDNDDDGDDEDGYTTLHKYWSKQDNNTIHGISGPELTHSEAFIFQGHLSTPSINIKFDNDAKRDSSLYVPNSNYYSYDWLVKRQIDNDLLLHGSLIRFIGLLAISLSEHEMVEVRTRYYYRDINRFFSFFLIENQPQLSKWGQDKVSSYLINKSYILSDLKRDLKDEPTVRFVDLLSQFQVLLNDLTHQSLIFDKWNKKVQEGLIEDYPWYRCYKKFAHFAQFKVSNHKLLHLERELTLNPRDYQFLQNGNGNDEKQKEAYFNHVIYGLPKFSVNSSTDYLNSRFKYSTFTNLHESVQESDFELTVKWLAVTYDKLRNLNYKMT